MSILNIEKRSEQGKVIDVFARTNEQEIRDNISYIDNDDLLEVKLGGFSGALSLKLQKQDGSKYFIKIIDYIDNFEIKIKEIMQIYKSCGIKTTNLVDSGVFKNNKFAYIVYEYFEGQPLHQVVDKITSEKLISIAHNTAIDMRKLRKVNTKNELFKIDKSQELETLTKTSIDNFIMVYNLHKDVINGYFSEETISSFINIFLENVKYFEKEKVLIHGDMKMQNILIDSNYENTLICDCDNLCYNYESFDIIWAYDICLKSDYEYDKIFLREYILTLYKNNVPKDIYKQLNYLSLLVFFLCIYEAYENNSMELLLHVLQRYTKVYTRTQGFSDIDYFELFK